ncbi:MAG: dihydroorotate dehydrogenase-like protein [Rikenellaceae bacterium]
MNTFNLTTSYLGLSLKNPFIVSSSGLTSTFKKVKACEEAGAGAVVLKSIFEEQISAQSAQMQQYNDYPEAADYLSGYMEQNALNEYITLIKECAENCEIPIIASINCSTSGSWVSYAQEFERAGAAAIELNIFALAASPSTTSAEIEAHYLSIVEAVKKVVNIPIAVKIPATFSAPVNMVQQLYFRAIKGVTMFNRFYTPDIDLKKLSVISSGVFSAPEELNSTLRWIALASTGVPIIDIAASTGIHTWQGAAKAFLCGARVVQLCTTLYKNGIDTLPTIIKDFKEWAQSEGFLSMQDIQGKLNTKNEQNAEIHERAQFMRYFSTFEE